MQPKIPLFEMHDFKHIIYFMSDTSSAHYFDLSVLYFNTISIIKARFHVTVRTQINKFVFYFTIRRDVKFWCRCKIGPNLFHRAKLAVESGIVS